jgi:uncharacterized protein YijF (DUF1287 family)
VTVTEVVQGVAAVLANVALMLVLALIAYGVKSLRAHASTRQVALFETLAHIGVTAAQQVGSTLNLDPKAKFIAAAVSLRELAAQHGYKLTDEQVTALIEKAVHDLKQDAALLTGATTTITPVVTTGPVST